MLQGFESGAVYRIRSQKMCPYGLTIYAHGDFIMRIFIQATTMPPTTDEQRLRRDAIRDLLSRGPAETQASLVSALENLGFVATQSSVSRDLRELGAIKTARGYELPGAAEPGDEQIAAVGDLLRSITPAGSNLLVIRTGIGAAQRVGLALDRSGWPGMVGTIAGDDTVFVATESAHAQKNLITRIEHATRS
jgi:transcriptional regulator of arginine metabolism